MSPQPASIPDGYVSLTMLVKRTGMPMPTLWRLADDGLLKLDPVGRPIGPRHQPQGLLPSERADAFVKVCQLAAAWDLPVTRLLRALRCGTHPQELAPLRPVMFPGTTSAHEQMQRVSA